MTPAQIRRRNLRKFDLTVELRDQLVDLQRGLCAVCHRPEVDAPKGRLAVDHDHEAGVIRGMLCGRCNTAIGLFREDPDALRQAIYYLSLPVTLEEEQPA